MREILRETVVEYVDGTGETKVKATHPLLLTEEGGVYSVVSAFPHGEVVERASRSRKRAEAEFSLLSLMSVPAEALA